MKDSERDFISSEVLTNFGKNMGQSQIDPERLREVLATTVAQHADRADITRLRDLGAQYFVVPNDDEGFELRLGHHDLAMLNKPGAVAGEYLGFVRPPTSRSRRAIDGACRGWQIPLESPPCQIPFRSEIGS